jgi:hypothetical protein
MAQVSLIYVERRHNPFNLQNQQCGARSPAHKLRGCTCGIKQYIPLNLVRNPTQDPQRLVFDFSSYFVLPSSHIYRGQSAEQTRPLADLNFKCERTGSLGTKFRSLPNDLGFQKY